MRFFPDILQAGGLAFAELARRGQLLQHQTRRVFGVRREHDGRGQLFRHGEVVFKAGRKRVAFQRHHALPGRDAIALFDTHHEAPAPDQILEAIARSGGCGIHMREAAQGTRVGGLRHEHADPALAPGQLQRE